MQGDGTIVLQPAMEDEMEEENKNSSMETSKQVGQWGHGGGTCMPWGICQWVQQVAGVPMKGGRETLLLWLVILVACAEKEGKKIGKSVRGKWFKFKYSVCPQVASGELSHTTDLASA